MSSPDPLVSWFVSQGGAFDHTAIGFGMLSDTGRSAIALKDIEEGHTLFSIPRSLLLSTRTSTLKSRLSEDEWNILGTGWASLILCMMWEQSKDPESVWAGYLNCLPSSFSTPMFWNEQDLAELQGTSVIEKIGKADADQDYQNRIVPLLSSKPELFPSQLHDTIFGLENFHRLGSAILSRSFHVEEWRNESGDNDETDSQSDPDDDEEEKEDTDDVAMVPMADMLNARFETDNARLFYEQSTVSMITTKPIKAGEQIWNTYGDPPNSDLLRRYGHVDLVPLPDEPDVLGNPADVVEIKADLALQACLDLGTGLTSEGAKERIDWWLEEGGDDVFVVEASDPEAPEGLVSLVKLFLMSADEYSKTKAKGRPPKPKLDSPEVVDAATKALVRRLGEYKTTLEEDVALLSNVSSLSSNGRNAVVVRLGEKRILRKVLESLQKAATELSSSSGGKSLKRGRGSDGDPVSKKSRR